MFFVKLMKMPSNPQPGLQYFILRAQTIQLYRQLRRLPVKLRRLRRVTPEGAGDLQSHILAEWRSAQRRLLTQSQEPNQSQEGNQNQKMHTKIDEKEWRKLLAHGQIQLREMSKWLGLAGVEIPPASKSSSPQA